MKLQLNISKWAARYGLDRATAKKRLNDAGIVPINEKAKETIFELTEEEASEVFKPPQSLDKVKLRKETADAELKELKVKKELGEVASVAEFKTVIQNVFGNLHKKCGVQMPKSIARKLVGKKQSEISKIISDEINKIFQDLRNDYKNFLDPELLEEKEDEL